MYYSHPKRLRTIIHPGPIDTDMNPANGEGSEAEKSLTAVGHYGTTDDIASMALHLAGQTGSFITGHLLLMVDTQYDGLDTTDYRWLIGNRMGYCIKTIIWTHEAVAQYHRHFHCRRQPLFAVPCTKVVAGRHSVCDMGRNRNTWCGDYGGCSPSEKPSWQKFVFLALILAGMVGLKVIEANPAQDTRVKYRINL